MSVTLTLAWRNLWRHKRRSWLTIGAMVFSNVLLVFMITLQFGSYEMMINNTLRAFSGHIQIAQVSYQEQQKMRLTVPQVAELARQLQARFPGIEVAPRALTFVLAASEDRSFGLQLAGVDAAREPSMSTIPGLMVEGRYLSAAGANEIVLGSVLARNLKVTVGDEITLLGTGVDGSLAAAVVSVSGIFDSGLADIDRSLAQILLRDFQSLFAMQDRGHAILVNAPDIAQTNFYQAEIKGWLSSRGVSDLEVLNWEQLNPGLRQAIQSDMASAWFMYMVLIVLVAFSALNTQLMSVLERTREFGIMSAVGVRTSTLGRLVLLESTVLAALGLLLGCALGALVALYFRVNGLSLPGMAEMAAQYNLPPKMYPSLQPMAILLGPLVVFMGCVSSALYPALKLTALTPVSAMRAV
ncbi:MAG: ABC transporter permease [Gammaproteobacteria bacterium]|nr:ABC transporter permease [Gammaproteobacteria bacterium]